LSDYIDITETPNPNHKTRKWLVRNISTQVYLGCIHWRTGFRKYVFQPDTTLQLDFDASCLSKIIEFLNYHTKKHYDLLGNYAELNNK
jgi:hypothetical protein